MTDDDHTAPTGGTTDAPTDDQPPAATIDVDSDAADAALRYTSERRHHGLDDYADLYQYAVGLHALLDQHRDLAGDLDSIGVEAPA